jgi:hypothetical protein
MSIAKTVEPACLGCCSVGFIGKSDSGKVGYSAPGTLPLVHSGD